jgi:hypothetical protein
VGAWVSAGIDCSVGFSGGGVPCSASPVRWRAGGFLLPSKRRKSTSQHLAKCACRGWCWC